MQEDEEVTWKDIQLMTQNLGDNLTDEEAKQMVKEMDAGNVNTIISNEEPSLFSLFVLRHYHYLLSLSSRFIH